MDICSYAYVCGPCRARRWDIFNCRGCCVQGIFSTKQIWSQIIVDICSFAYVCGPCRARRWGIFNCRGCCVQPINLHVSCLKNWDLTVVRFKTVRSYSCPPWNCKILQLSQCQESTHSFHWQLGHWQLSPLTVVSTDSCPHWQLSPLTVVRTDSCPIWQLSDLTVVWSDS